MKTPGVVALVVGVHAIGIGALMLSQGCGTRQPRVEPPPAPVMPPRAVTPPAAPLPPPAPAAPKEWSAPTLRPLPEEQTRTYVVQPGDTLSRIAQRHGVSTRELIELNKLEKPDKLKVGQKLQLPAHATAPTAPAAPRKPSAPAPVPPGSIEYRVMPGDTLGHIARAFGVKVSEIREANQLSGDRIDVGQRLIIPNPKKTPAKTEPARAPAPATTSAPAAAPAAAPATSATPPPAPMPAPSALAPAPIAPATPVATTPAAPPTTTAPAASQPVPYVVREGDTIAGIAKTFMVSAASLRQVNNLGLDEEVKPGQRILIPVSD